MSPVWILTETRPQGAIIQADISDYNKWRGALALKGKNHAQTLETDPGGSQSRSHIDDDQCRSRPVDWAFWGGDPGGAHYSTLADINTGNVAQLRQAWVWKTGETELKEYGTRPGMFENTPVVIDNVMYVTTPYNKVVALESGNGRGTVELRSEILRRRPAAQRNRIRASRDRRCGAMRAQAINRAFS